MKSKPKVHKSQTSLEDPTKDKIGKVNIKKARKMIVASVPNGYKNPLIKTIEKIKIDVPEGCPPLHTTSVFVGSCNSGKTNWMLNLAKIYADYDSFNRIFVLSPTFENNQAFDILDIKPEDVYSGKRVLNDGVSCVMEVEEKMKKMASDYAEYEEYCEAHKAWLYGIENARQATLVSNNCNAAPIPMPRPSVLLMMDDLSHTTVFSVGRENSFINLLLRHRHVYGIGLSIFMCVQNFNTGIPKILRQNIRQFFLFKTHDQTQKKAMYEQLAQGFTEEVFNFAFDYATAEPHSFLTVDQTSDGPSTLRKNFDEYLIFPEGDIEEDVEHVK